MQFIVAVIFLFVQAQLITKYEITRIPEKPLKVIVD